MIGAYKQYLLNIQAARISNRPSSKYSLLWLARKSGDSVKPYLQVTSESQDLTGKKWIKKAIFSSASSDWTAISSQLWVFLSWPMTQKIDRPHQCGQPHETGSFKLLFLVHGKLKSDGTSMGRITAPIFSSIATSTHSCPWRLPLPWGDFVSLVFHDLGMSRLFQCFQVRNAPAKCQGCSDAIRIQWQQAGIEARCECSLTPEESYSEVSRMLRK